MVENKPKSGESEKEFFCRQKRWHIIHVNKDEKCILFVSYCYCVLANRKLSISHSKGINSGVDNVSHLDLSWGKVLCPTLTFDLWCLCILF